MRNGDHKIFFLEMSSVIPSKDDSAVTCSDNLVLQNFWHLLFNILRFVVKYTLVMPVSRSRKYSLEIPHYLRRSMNTWMFLPVPFWSHLYKLVWLMNLRRKAAKTKIRKPCNFITKIADSLICLVFVDCSRFHCDLIIAYY